MTGARLYCFDCGQPYVADPMKRVRCHSGDMLSTELRTNSSSNGGGRTTL